MSRFFDALHKTSRIIEEPVKEPAIISDPDGREFLESAIEQAHVDPESHLEVFTVPHGLAADRFRMLRLHLREAGARNKLKTLLLTSPLPEDGKSTIALNLAT